ncbi:hypothetical protein MSAS_21910 [Mycobacterium saskatchewanense]|nr:hypothetical protein MSAS_21910 [Mycobacterium saskatchewanense]
MIPKITSAFDALMPPSAKTAPPESHLMGSFEVHYPRRPIPTLDTARGSDNRSASRA